MLVGTCTLDNSPFKRFQLRSFLDALKIRRRELHIVAVATNELKEETAIKQIKDAPCGTLVI